MNSRNIRCEGFSLVEVALALVVVSIGLTAVFALFPHGTEANRRAIQDTQIGLFAEYVLNGFRMEADEVPWDSVVDSPSFSISALASDYAWESPSAISAGAGVKTLSYKAKADSTIEEMAFRYELRVSAVAGKPDVKALILRVWPGQYGLLVATNVFYTEVYNYGG